MTLDEFPKEAAAGLFFTHREYWDMCWPGLNRQLMVDLCFSESNNRPYKRALALTRTEINSACGILHFPADLTILGYLSLTGSFHLLFGLIVLMQDYMF